MSGPEIANLMVTAMTIESAGVITLRLSDPEGRDLPAWKPGAHIDIHPDGGELRQYSLCGKVTDRKNYCISVLREEAGRGGSRFVHDSVRPGNVVKVSQPRNHFALKPAERYIFIAGGIGITPIIPMIAAARATGTPWTLLYGGRSRRSMAFLDQLQSYQGCTRVFPQDEVGHIPLAEYLGDPEEGMHVYCCGPEPLIAAVEQLCATYPAGMLQVERFTAAELTEANQAGSKAFKVLLKKTGKTVEIPQDMTIMEALEEEGMDVPFSCRAGTCGMCETAVLEGKVDHRDAILSQEERAANNTMLICCSRAISDELVLDF